MEGFTSESDARLEFTRRIRHALERQLVEDGVDVAEIEEARPDLVETARYILDSIQYQAKQLDDGSYTLVFTR